MVKTVNKYLVILLLASLRNWDREQMETSMKNGKTHLLNYKFLSFLRPLLV